MKYYEELKSKSEIIGIASKLGFNGTITGSAWQGDCPDHGSSKGRCLTIWPRTQSFKCFHCGKKGDVINLVILYKKCDHRTAVNFLADQCGMPRLESRNLSPEQKAKMEADYQEEKLVRDMLTEESRWFHGQLDNYPDIKKHLKEHYKFSDQIIEELQIGFAPPPQKDQKSILATHLESIPEFKGKLALSGLFNYKDPAKGPFYDFFKGRIIFPYWKNGKVAYMKARSTTLTPNDKYECFTDKDGNVKLNDQGNPEYIKYKALRSHDPGDEKKQHISKFIQNDTFLGEDSIRGAKEIIITEGVPDWVSAIDHGFAALSPGTTNFREADFPKLDQLTRHIQTIWIINDNENNHAGYDAAIKTGILLTKLGRNVFLVELPKPSGVSKIDLNEYFLDHSADDLQNLLKESKSVLEILIDQLPEDFLKALPQIQSDIAPILAGLEDGMLEHYIGQLKKKTKTTKSAIVSEVDAAKLRLAQEQEKKKEKPVDPEILKKSQEIAQDSMLFKKRLDLINKAGVVGERKIMAMYYVTLDSRLLPENTVSPNVLATKNAGHQGSGKSYTLGMVLYIYPENCYHMITNGSAKSLYYLKGGLKHKSLIVTEGFQFQQKNAQDSELAYTVRTLISEGRISYLTVQKDSDGNQETVEKKIAGPTSFITTTVLEKLESQLEDRLFSIHPDESIGQTKDIISLTGQMDAGLIPKLDEKTVNSWKVFHESLKPIDVLIPFAPKIAAYINQSPVPPLATRRAFKRVLSVIKAIVCAYQYQRERNQADQVIAEICDYWMALQIVNESFQENMGSQSSQNKDKLALIAEKGPIKYKSLEKEWAVSTSAISSWVQARIKEGIVEWCDKDGNLFVDDKALKTAKHSGKALIKISATYTPPGSVDLPTPYDLTGDANWDEGGRLLKEYDLELDFRPRCSSVSTGVKAVSMPVVDTLDTSDVVDNIEYNPVLDIGINVLTQYMDDEGHFSF